MYRTCFSNLCSTNCCDYYAYCVYPQNTLVCYPSVTYYYYDYWWVWTLCSILLICIIVAAVAGARRRRMQRMMQREEIIITNNTNPGFVSGQPVYGDTIVTGQPYYNQPLVWSSLSSITLLLSIRVITYFITLNFQS